jgi:peptidoglycan/LPS O-acetylase OafA/YrhL
LAAVILATFALATLGLGGGFGGPGLWAALGTAGALWFASRHDHLAARLIAFRTFTWLGAVSYSLYLAHVTVLSPFVNLSQRAISPGSIAFIGVWLIAVPLSLLAWWLMHRWVEAPVERWPKLRWSHSPTPA